MFRKFSFLLCIIFAVTMVGCGAKTDSISINVSAASSLTESLNEIKNLYKTKTGTDINLNFASSGVLKTQIEQGADVDIFLSANFSHYDDLNKLGLIKNGKQFAENSLVLAVSSENTTIEKLEDISKTDTKVIFANDSVPVGKYTLEILDNYNEILGDDFSEKVKSNVVSQEENVRQVLSKVALGEGDCAIVYATDITSSVKDKVRVIEINEECNVKGEYWAGVIKKDSLNTAADDFFEYIFSDAAADIFRKYGFTTM